MFPNPALAQDLASAKAGMGFIDIELNKALCLTTVLINTHMLMAARDAGVEAASFRPQPVFTRRISRSSTAVVPVREEDAYPAMPEDGYGWEKLFSERMCRHFSEDFGMVTGRLGITMCTDHVVPMPAAARKHPPLSVVEAQLSGCPTIEIWGDGEQTRSFTYIDDCVEGTLRLMESQVPEPLNIGSDQLVSVNQLVAQMSKSPVLAVTG